MSDDGERYVIVHPFSEDDPRFQALDPEEQELLRQLRATFIANNGIVPLSEIVFDDE